ncbi:MAG: TIM barrel protein [Rhodobacteraceae bacterium]|nr:TIM barrel protein [Paracoccaceae bacterium]
MMRFSANTGFLFKDLTFLERIGAARAAGFDAVEFHDEAQSVDPGKLAATLAVAGLPVCGINIRMGDTAGCAAIPGAEAQARADIDAAVAVANAVDSATIHVLSGRTDAELARSCLIENLRYALERCDRVILIEPICRAAMPGYFLHDLDQAVGILNEINHPRLKILFDCYHIEMQHGDCLTRFVSVANRVGHIQIASVPGRNEPTSGELDYGALLPQIVRAGYGGVFGCEYRALSQCKTVLPLLRRYENV